MKYDPNVIELCNQVDISKFKDYLFSRKWINVSTKLKNALVFEKSKQEKVFQLLIPVDKKLLDYNYRIYEAIVNLSEFEERDLISILNDIRLPVADIIRVSIKDTDTADGTIPFDDGISLLENARKAIIAAAYSVDNPEKFHARAYNEDIEKLISSCRLGQTEIGSFVATVICPVNADVQSTLNGKKIQEFGRKTTLNLMSSLSHLINSIDKKELKRVINPLEGDPVISANLCEAITDLKPNSDKFSINFRITWAKGSEPKNVPNEVKIENFHLPDIELVTNQLKPQKINKVEEFVGKVAVLKGEPYNKQVQGEVILRLITEDDIIRVKVKLNRPDYKLASELHVNNKNMIIKGRLTRESTRVYTITDYQWLRELPNQNQK